MQAQLRAELDELVVAADALPLARERETHLRVLAEQAANELSAIRRRSANGGTRVRMSLVVCLFA